MRKVGKFRFLFNSFGFKPGISRFLDIFDMKLHETCCFSTSKRLFLHISILSTASTGVFSVGVCAAQRHRAARRWCHLRKSQSGGRYECSHISSYFIQACNLGCDLPQKKSRIWLLWKPDICSALLSRCVVPNAWECNPQLRQTSVAESAGWTTLHKKRVARQWKNRWKNGLSLQHSCPVSHRNWSNW